MQSTRRSFLGSISSAAALPALTGPAPGPSARRPAVLPYRPRPVGLLVCQTHGPAPDTCITRIWPEGTGWCGRCPESFCAVHRDVCMIVVPGIVPNHQAAEYEVSPDQVG